MHIYVFWRVSSVPVIKRKIPRKWLVATAVTLWALFIAGRTFGHGNENDLAATLELLGMNWMASLFLIFICMLLVDGITLFGYLFSHLAPTLRGLALITGIGLAAFAHVQAFRPPLVENHEVHLPGLTASLDGTVMIGVSDMHLGSLIGPTWLADRIAQIRHENPDIIVFIGDTFEGHGSPYEIFVPLLGRLSAPLGVWCVPGNHGSRTSMEIMRKAGFNVVEGCWNEVQPGLVLAGLPARHRGTPDNEVVLKALAGRPAGATVLLAHKPNMEYAETAAQAGVGLMLSGHTHGGQVWPFDYLVKYAYPLLDGSYNVDGMQVIVGRGAGTWGPRMRLWERGSLLKITLRTASEAVALGTLNNSQ